MNANEVLSLDFNEEDSEMILETYQQLTGSIEEKMLDGTATDSEILDWLDPSNNYPDAMTLSEMANEIMGQAEHRTYEIIEPHFTPDENETWSEIAANLSRRYAIAADLYRRAEEQK